MTQTSKLFWHSHSAVLHVPKLLTEKLYFLLAYLLLAKHLQNLCVCVNNAVIVFTLHLYLVLKEVSNLACLYDVFVLVI